MKAVPEARVAGTAVSKTHKAVAERMPEAPVEVCCTRTGCSSAEEASDNRDPAEVERSSPSDRTAQADSYGEASVDRDEVDRFADTEDTVGRT